MAPKTYGDKSCGERGSATVYAIVFVALLATVTVVATVVAAVLVGQRRAAAAADLSALAGAAAVQHGDEGCAAARRIAEQNDADLVECVESGGVVTVEVRHVVRSVLRSDVDVRARARAGPVSRGLLGIRG
jgi:secretion/DNA translocation related TadE-like protein